MTYSIALRAPTGLDPDLERLWRDSLAMEGDLAGRLAWAYRDNPVGPGAILALLDPGGAMVGCAGLVPRRFTAGGRPVVGAAYGDFAVAPDHRTLLPALELQRETGRHALREWHFGYGFPGSAAQGLFRRLGHVQVGIMTRYARVLRVAPHVRERWRWAAGIAAAADAMRSGLRRRAGRDPLELEWLERPDGRFDALHATASRFFPILGDRGRKALAWRFFGRPGAACRLFGISDRVGDRLRGYAVIEESGPSGRRTATIKDFLAGTEADLGRLLARLAAALAAEGFATLSVRFLGTDRVTGRLLAAGFERRAEERPFMIQAGERPGMTPLLLDRESWFLTDGDEDW